jgi:hypothetical protein
VSWLVGGTVARYRDSLTLMSRHEESPRPLEFINVRVVSRNCSVIGAERGAAHGHGRLETELGNIVMEVDARTRERGELSQLRRRQVLRRRMVNQSVRHNTTRRDVEIQVIQFQSDQARQREMFPPIRWNDERDRIETSMARLDGEGGPDSATASFFIAIGDQPSSTSPASETRTARASRCLAGWCRHGCREENSRVKAGTAGSYSTDVDPPIAVQRRTR